MGGFRIVTVMTDLGPEFSDVSSHLRNGIEDFFFHFRDPVLLTTDYRVG